MSKTDFKQLKIWQLSKDLAVEIYKITSTSGFVKDYSLKDQIRRAAVSVPSNIAEGNERESNKEMIRFLYIAKGSVGELRTQLEISKEIGYISKDQQVELEKKCALIANSIGALIRSMNQ